LAFYSAFIQHSAFFSIEAEQKPGEAEKPNQHLASFGFQLYSALFSFALFYYSNIRLHSASFSFSFSFIRLCSAFGFVQLHLALIQPGG
jgi:hypothetical protein